MMTIYSFRIQPQIPFFDSPITIQILKCQNQSLTFANLMDKLMQSLPDNFCLTNYTIFIGNNVGTKIELVNDYTLKRALSTLRLNKLEIFLHPQRSFNMNHTSTYSNTVPLIKPKVIRLNQYKNQNNTSAEQQRKDSGIELEAHVFPTSAAIYGNHLEGSDYQKNNNSKRPSLNMLLSPKGNSGDDLPRISHSVGSSPSSSPSTIASSSPSSPMIAFSTSAFATPAMKSCKKLKCSSSWSPVDHSSPPSSTYYCEKVMDSGKKCGQTFQRPYDLARHQTIHLKNRPFVYCQQCGKRFTRVDALRRHERVQGHLQIQKRDRNYHPHHKVHPHPQYIHHHLHHHSSLSVYPI